MVFPRLLLIIRRIFATGCIFPHRPFVPRGGRLCLMVCGLPLDGRQEALRLELVREETPVCDERLAVGGQIVVDDLFHLAVEQRELFYQQLRRGLPILNRIQVAEGGRQIQVVLQGLRQILERGLTDRVRVLVFRVVFRHRREYLDDRLRDAVDQRRDVLGHSAVDVVRQRIERRLDFGRAHLSADAALERPARRRRQIADAVGSEHDREPELVDHAGKERTQRCQRRERAGDVLVPVEEQYQAFHAYW